MEQEEVGGDMAGRASVSTVFVNVDVVSRRHLLSWPLLHLLRMSADMLRHS